MHRWRYRVSLTVLVSALVAFIGLSPFRITAQSVDEGTPVTVAEKPTIEATITEILPTETPSSEPVATDAPTLVPAATEIPATATPTQVPAMDTEVPIAPVASPSTSMPSPTQTNETRIPSLEATTIEPVSCSLNSPAGPSTSDTARRDTNATLSASITGSSMAWSRVYSFSPQYVSGSLSYQVTGNGCTGWNVQVAATDFIYSGAAGGTAIPNGDASVAPGTPIAVTGSLTGLTAGSGGALGSSQKVLSASATNGLGTYDQLLSIGVTIPGGARVGSYASTFTITAAAGP